MQIHIRDLYLLKKLIYIYIYLYYLRSKKLFKFSVYTFIFTQLDQNNNIDSTIT